MIRYEHPFPTYLGWTGDIQLEPNKEATKLREEIELLELRVKKLKLMQEKRMIEEQLNMAEGLSDN